MSERIVVISGATGQQDRFAKAARAADVQHYVYALKK